MKLGPRSKTFACLLWQTMKRVEAQPNALLMLLLFLLLVGLAHVLPPPPPASPPAIFTDVAYSTVVSEIQAGEVLAVHLEGTTLNGLRTRERTTMVVSPHPRQGRNTGRRQIEQDPEVESFLACLPEVTPGCFDDNEEPRYPRARLLFALVEDARAAATGGTAAQAESGGKYRSSLYSTTVGPIDLESWPPVALVPAHPGN